MLCICIYIYIHNIYIYMYTYTQCIADGGRTSAGCSRPPSPPAASGRGLYHIHTCHILPPSEIDSGLRLAVFAGSGGKHLFHRIC